MRMNCIACRSDPTLEDTSNKKILLIDMACSNECNKVAKQDRKIFQEMQKT